MSWVIRRWSFNAYEYLVRATTEKDQWSRTRAFAHRFNRKYRAAAVRNMVRECMVSNQRSCRVVKLVPRHA